MEWIFETITKKYSNPFLSNVLSIESTPQRTDYGNCSKESLIYFDGSKGRYYAKGENASFTIEFKRSPYVFSKYKMRGIVTSCSPYKWKVFGSIDNNSYTLLHYVDRSLCNVTQRFDSECVETFAMSNIKKVKYIKVINTNGECQGNSYFFGLHGIDFYGTSVQNTIVICKRFYKTIIVCLILAVFIS